MEQYVSYALVYSNGSFYAPLGDGTPWTKVSILPYELPAPDITALGNGLYSVRLHGAVEAAGTPNGQSVHVQLIENDPLYNDLLHDRTFSITHAADLWDGVLVAYEITTPLVLDSNGHLHGTDGSDTDEGGSGFELFQRLIGAGLDSDSVDLP
jgi:hypothetical protein